MYCVGSNAKRRRESPSSSATLANNRLVDVVEASLSRDRSASSSKVKRRAVAQAVSNAILLHAAADSHIVATPSTNSSPQRSYRVSSHRHPKQWQEGRGPVAADIEKAQWKAATQPLSAEQWERLANVQVAWSGHEALGEEQDEVFGEEERQAKPRHVNFEDGTHSTTTTALKTLEESNDGPSYLVRRRRASSPPPASTTTTTTVMDLSRVSLHRPSSLSPSPNRRRNSPSLCTHIVLPRGATLTEIPSSKKKVSAASSSRERSSSSQKPMAFVLDEHTKFYNVFPSPEQQPQQQNRSSASSEPVDAHDASTGTSGVFPPPGAIPSLSSASQTQQQERHDVAVGGRDDAAVGDYDSPTHFLSSRRSTALPSPSTSPPPLPSQSPKKGPNVLVVVPSSLSPPIAPIVDDPTVQQQQQDAAHPPFTVELYPALETPKRGLPHDGGSTTSDGRSPRRPVAGLSFGQRPLSAIGKSPTFGSFLMHDGECPTPMTAGGGGHLATTPTGFFDSSMNLTAPPGKGGLRRQSDVPLSPPSSAEADNLLLALTPQFEKDDEGRPNGNVRRPDLMTTPPRPPLQVEGGGGTPHLLKVEIVPVHQGGGGEEQNRPAAEIGGGSSSSPGPRRPVPRHVLSGAAEQLQQQPPSNAQTEHSASPPIRKPRPLPLPSDADQATLEKWQARRALLDDTASYVGGMVQQPKPPKQVSIAAEESPQSNAPNSAGSVGRPIPQMLRPSPQQQSDDTNREPSSSSPPPPALSSTIAALDNASPASPLVPPSAISTTSTTGDSLHAPPARHLPSPSEATHLQPLGPVTATTAPEAAAPSSAASPTRNQNIVKRAKAANFFTALNEYRAACETYLSALRIIKSKLPSETNDAVRDVMAFALSFTKAMQVFRHALLDVPANAEKVRQGNLADPSSGTWLGRDSIETDDAAYQRLLHILEEEIETLTKRRETVQRNAQAQNELSSFCATLRRFLQTVQVRVALGNNEALPWSASLMQHLPAFAFRASLGESIPRLLQEERPQQYAALRDAFLLPHVSLSDAFQQRVAQSQSDEVSFLVLHELAKMYPQGALPQEMVTTVLPRMVEKLKVEFVGELRQYSSFQQVLPTVEQFEAHVRNLGEGEASGNRPAMVAWAAYQDAVSATKKFVEFYTSHDTSLSAQSPPRASHASQMSFSGSLPFAALVTSQVHLRPADSEERHLSKMCSDTQRYAKEHPGEYARITSSSSSSSSPAYRTLHSLRAVALQQLQSHVALFEQFGLVLQQDLSQWAVMTAKLIQAIQEQQLPIISSSQPVVDSNEALQRLQDWYRANASKMEVEDLKPMDAFLAKRRRVCALLDEEVRLVRTLDQIPLQLDDSLFVWQGTSTADTSHADPTTGPLDRCRRLTAALDANRQVSKANFLILGNTLMKANSSSRQNPQPLPNENKVSECVEALARVQEAQEVVAASLRRTMQAKNAREKSITTAAATAVANTDETCKKLYQELFRRAEAPPGIPANLTTSFGSKLSLLVHIGIVVFARTNVRTTSSSSSSEIVRFLLTLHTDDATLRFSNPHRLASSTTSTTAEQADELAAEIEPISPVPLREVDLLLQGPSVGVNASASAAAGSTGNLTLQTMRVMPRDDAPSMTSERRILFPNFASFTEWSEVLLVVVRNVA